MHGRDSRVTVLLLDGGGVRGLSSLLILQRLMMEINVAAEDQDYDGEEILPRHVFDLVAGTSTGGLIAIMLGKLGMSVQDCILAYQNMSSDVFGSKRKRGILSLGLARSRYRGTNLTNSVKRLLREREKSESLPMVDDTRNPQDMIKSAVVCREHESASKYSDLKPEPACICSTACCPSFHSNVCEAARATSAAWTYFNIKKIGSRYFSDGGVEHNNPSTAIWEHYTLKRRLESTRARPEIPADLVDHAAHDVGSFNTVSFVNIGTGSKDHETPTRKRAKFTHLVPGMVRMGVFLKQTLAEVATASDVVAKTFETHEALNPMRVRYWRLSANNGVCWIKLDRYKELHTIERLTNTWLDANEVQIKHVAVEVATEYLAKLRLAE